MKLRSYPEEIQKLIDIWDPYKNRIKDGVLTNAPQKAIDAYEKTKKWALELGQ